MSHSSESYKKYQLHFVYREIKIEKKTLKLSSAAQFEEALEKQENIPALAKVLEIVYGSSQHWKNFSSIVRPSITFNFFPATEV